MIAELVWARLQKQLHADRDTGCSMPVLWEQRLNVFEELAGWLRKYNSSN